MISLRSLIRIAAVSLLLLNVYAVFFSRRGLRDLGRIRGESQSLGQRLDQVKLDKEQLEKKVAALKNDPREQEGSVRQTLGYVRPGELVVEFP